MDEFNEQLKENLENRPEPEFDEQSWLALERELDGKRRAGGALWWGFPLLLLVLLGTNIWTFSNWQKADQESSVTHVVNDTIFKTRVVYETDTVVKTIYLNPKTNNSARTLVNAPHPAINTALKGFEKYRLPSEFKLNVNRNFDNYIPVTATSFEKDESQFTESLSGFTISLVADDQPGFAVPLYPTKEIKRKKRKINLGKVLVPKSMQIGWEGGSLLPFGEDIEETRGFTTGLKMNLSFSETFQFWAEGTYQNIIYETKTMNDALGVPVIAAPGPDFQFNKATVKLPSYQVGLGFQYLLLPQKNWRPFVGLGYAFVSAHDYEVNYDFESPLFDIEVSNDQTLESSRLVSDLWIAKAGLQVKISKPIRWQIEAMYRGDFSSQQFYAPNGLGIKSAILYRF